MRWKKKEKLKRIENEELWKNHKNRDGASPSGLS